MIFGSKNDFAIEAFIEPGLNAPSAVWGRMCIWIAGNRIGDIDDPHCSLYTAYDSFIEASEMVNTLWEAQFSEMQDSEIFYYLDELLYGYRGEVESKKERSLEQCEADWDDYGKFNFLTNWGEMFDSSGKAFLLKEPIGQLRVIIYVTDRSKTDTHVCSEFGFRHAVKLFSKWYDEQTKILSGDHA